MAAGCNLLVPDFETGADHDGPDATAAASTPFPTAAPECSTCLEICDEPAQICAADDVCRELHDCVLDCERNDVSCRGVCYETFPAESESIRNFDLCLRSNCVSACLGTGGYSTISAGTDASPCDQCIVDNGCISANTGDCATLGCERLTECRSTDDPASLLACGEAQRKLRNREACTDGTVRPLMSAVESGIDAAFCSLESCSAECGSGTDWSCLGDYRWVGSGQGTIDRGWTFNDFGTTNGAIDGLNVRACRTMADIECAVDPIQTSTNGVACLSLNVALGLYKGYFRLDHPSYHKTLVFPGAPLTGSFGPEVTTLSTRAIFESFSRLEGVEPDPELGHITIGIFSCTYAGAPNMRFVLDGASASTTEAEWYLDENDVPKVTAGRTAGDIAFGGFVNVTPGYYVVRAVDADTLELRACHRIFVEPDSVSWVRLLPLDHDDEASCGG